MAMPRNVATFLVRHVAQLGNSRQLQRAGGRDDDVNSGRISPLAIRFSSTTVVGFIHLPPTTTGGDAPVAIRPST
jgi:hypothetical protein